jgi:hypothetical protein
MKQTVTIVIAVGVAVIVFWSRSWALREGLKDEYRGWRKFHQAAGVWPIWSMVSLLSIPLLFVGGGLLCIRAFETNRLPVIYTVLVSTILALALVWFGLRRLANWADMTRAHKLTGRVPSSAERFIR